MRMRTPGANSSDPSIKIEHITCGYEGVQKLLKLLGEFLTQSNKKLFMQQMMENFCQANNHRNESTGVTRKVMGTF